MSESLLRVAIPPGTPVETAAAMRRLTEMTSALARRCAQLQAALDSRVAIEQAKGIVAERLGIDTDSAFRVLRRAARENRVRLSDLAARVVSTREAPEQAAAHLASAD